MVIREVESDADRVAVQALLCEAFDIRPGVGVAFAQLYLDVITKTSAHSYVVVIDGQVVGHALLALRTFVIDGVHLPGGILAMVAVASKYRGRGIGSALVHRAESQARKAGVLLLHVAGDPQFYMRFGFVPAYLQGRAVHDAVLDGEAPVLREATPGDVAHLVALSALETPVGALLADQDRWNWVLSTRHPTSLVMHNDRFFGFCATDDACLIADDIGFIRVCWNQETLAIYEAGSLDATNRLLRAVCQWAVEKGFQEVVCYLPPRNRLMQAVVNGGATLEVWEENELQIKVLDVGGVMARCRDLLRRRAQNASLHGSLKLQVGSEGFVFHFGAFRPGEDICEIFLPEIGFARAIMGTDCLSDRLGENGHSDMRQMLNVLFPQLGPFFW
ncbi:MAG: N-acetyltransferase, partial [Candidatus Latescibacteria bacterium]|nr:N-acetyltransferase [Candidatus Latescibacterota bacterium]